MGNPNSKPKSNPQQYGGKKGKSLHNYSFAPTLHLKKNLEKLVADDEFKAIEYYDTINGALSYGPTEDAFQEGHKGRNRYQAVVPYDDNRVRLGKEADTESDYINASDVKSDDYRYICAQGPLPETTNDFWRMVWEQNVPVILMLTKTIEGGKLKCHRYYPEKEDTEDLQQFGTIRVEPISTAEDSKTTITTRKFKLVNSKFPTESRTLIHYQYTGWPDHGVPDNTHGIRDLIDQIDNHIATTHATGPILVHCSAGIGRTGTFCTIHIQIHRLRKHMKENPNTAYEFAIYDIVKDLRKKRTGMVQQLEQYRFCYEAIADEAKKMGYVVPQGAVLKKSKSETAPPEQQTDD